MQLLRGLWRRGHESVKLFVINMFIEWTSHSDTSHITNTSSRGDLLLALLLVIVGNPSRTKDLLPNAMLQPFNDASNSLGSPSDGRQGSNLFGTHSLPEVEPENHTIALLVGSGQAMLQVFIDFLQENSESDSLLAPMNLFPGLGVEIARRNMRFVAPG